ncbi:MAG: glycosyltransferase [Chloroflexota bacterium]|nr:MAG: glycosyltransferase [Chloroflexota bacterium]
MKLVVVGPIYPYRGGIAHYNAQLCRELIKDNHIIDIFSFQRQYPSWLYPGKSDKEPTQPQSKLDVEYSLDPVYPWTWFRTASVVNKKNPDAVLIHWWTTFWAPAYWVFAKLIRRNGVKIIFLIHNVTPHEPLPWDNLLARNVLKLGNVQIVQTQNEQERLHKLVPKANSILSPHPIYNQFNYERMLSKSEARKQIKVNPDRPTLLFFGIVRPYKGLKYAIEAISILESKGTRVQLVVAGEFWEDIIEYEKMLINLDLCEQVFLYDRYIPNEEVGLFYSAADIFIAPYIDGTQSGSVKIALSFNLPIVITDKISDQILKEAMNVQVIPSKDSHALASAIERSLASDQVAKEIVKSEDVSWNKLIGYIEEATYANNR